MVKKEHLVQNAEKTGNEECVVQKIPKMSTWSKTNVKKELLIQSKPNNVKKEHVIQKGAPDPKQTKQCKKVARSKKKQRSTWSKKGKKEHLIQNKSSNVKK